MEDSKQSQTKGAQKCVKKRLFRYVVIACCGFFVVSIMLTLPLRWLNPFTTAFIVQESIIYKRFTPLEWVPYEEIAKTVPIAIVASEDQKFPIHYGFDFDAVYKALTESRKKMRGASTISQQLAKNLYLWPGRSLVRKGLEAYFTALLELFLHKRRILEIYLNVVEFGPAIYGVGPASQKIFSRSPSRINGYQAALLAAVLPNPKKLSAKNPSNYVSGRALHIQKSVRSLGGSAYLRDL